MSDIDELEGGDGREGSIAELLPFTRALAVELDAVRSSYRARPDVADVLARAMAMDPARVPAGLRATLRSIRRSMKKSTRIRACSRLRRRCASDTSGCCTSAATRRFRPRRSRGAGGRRWSLRSRPRSS